MLSALALLLAPALVSAHGAVTSYKIGGKEYPGYEVSRKNDFPRIAFEPIKLVVKNVPC